MAFGCLVFGSWWDGGHVLCLRVPIPIFRYVPLKKEISEMR